MRVYMSRDVLIGDRHMTVMYEGDAPDGALYLEIGSCFDVDGVTRLPPIDCIDHEAGYYTRSLSTTKHPIPEATYCHEDVDWKPAG